MRVRNVLIVFVVFFPAFCAIVAGPESGGAAEKKSAADNQHIWFPVGEVLDHKIYWGVIPVGYSRTTSQWTEKDGKKVLVLRIETKTNKVFDRIRPVDDVVESIMEPGKFVPHTFKRKMIRRGSECDELTVFDHSKEKAAWMSKCSGQTKTFKIKSDTLDILSFLFKLRRRPLGENTMRDVRVMADEGMHDLKIRTREVETVKLPGYGKVRSLKVEPEFNFDGLLVKRGKFTIWVSDDDRRIITRAEIKGKIADIKIILTGVSGPMDDFWTKNRPQDEAKDDG